MPNCKRLEQNGAYDFAAPETIPSGANSTASSTILWCSIREGGARRKIVVFTEARDTLEYLAGRIRDRTGEPESVAIIHGSVPRDRRRATIAAFNDDPTVRFLLANDAAGEGVNLQRGAHLMVNYDLPWNPNRLEQRFGRIHRIGQTEVCHLWNLVASETREGAVYQRLLEKLETARATSRRQGL